MVVFLDYDGVVNTIIWEYNPETNKYRADYSFPRRNKVNNYQAVQWLSELCIKYGIDIVVTSTWRMSENYKECLINSGLRDGIKILGKVPEVSTNKCVQTLRAEQINQYLKANPEIGNQFIILDDDYVDVSAYGYNNKDHFIRCRTNAGFGLEEFEEAVKKVEFLKSLKGGN
jgi:hypothetical protein